MSDEPPDPTEGDPGELESIVRQLQGQVDHLAGRNRALERRIQRLERDRETLRHRIDSAAAESIPRRLIRAFRPSSSGVGRERVAGPVQSSDELGGIELPDGVGYIPRLSLPPAPVRRPDLRVAAILDPFSQASLAPECRLEPLVLDTWRAQVEEEPPALLLVESAFVGPGGSWPHRIARVGTPHPDLVQVVEWCRHRDIPTAFWNKEDPTNFRWFIASAALFDWVFTVDGDTVDRYRQVLGHERVGVMPFAAQPAYHYPPETERPGRVAFAGSYYAQKHPERLQQVDTIIDPAREFGLHIFDRMGTRQDDRFGWPERFVPHIVGSLSYPQVLEAYRRYRVFLNVNTVTSSPTMCARRLFELAASGTPVVTGPARAVDEMIPPGAVAVCYTPEGAREAIRGLLEDEDRWRQQADLARDWVLERHTYEHRLAALLRTIGLARSVGQ